ncbi:hypothetical protein AB0L06_05575 [Spirillospora sp. NPDC052269]
MPQPQNALTNAEGRSVDALTSAVGASVDALTSVNGLVAADGPAAGSAFRTEADPLSTGVGAGGGAEVNGVVRGGDGSLVGSATLTLIDVSGRRLVRPEQ